MTSPRPVVCVILIGSVLVAPLMGDGTLQATAMAALTVALGSAVAWLFGDGGDKPTR